MKKSPSSSPEAGNATPDTTSNSGAQTAVAKSNGTRNISSKTPGNAQRDPLAPIDRRPNRDQVPLATRAEVDEVRRDIARILALLEPPSNGGAVPNGGAATPGATPPQQWPTGNSNPVGGQSPGGGQPGLGAFSQLGQLKQVMETFDDKGASGQFNAEGMLYMILGSHLKLMDAVVGTVVGSKIQQAVTVPLPK